MIDDVVEWLCGYCRKSTSVTHFLQRDGVMVHDPQAAYRVAAGLDEEEPLPPGSNQASS